MDLRGTGLGGSLELYNNITFDGGAYCRDLGPSSVGKSIVNKNTLQTGQLITQQSLSPTLSPLFQSAVKKELLGLKGKPSSFTTIYKDPSISGNPTFRTYTNGVELVISFNNDLPNGIYKYTFDIISASTAQSVKVFLYGECGGSGYKATTTYEHWDGTAHGTTKQNNVADGYFHRMYGKHVHVTGHFRNFGKKVINYGKSYAMNDAGAYEFVLQKIVCKIGRAKGSRSRYDMALRERDCQ